MSAEAPVLGRLGLVASEFAKLPAFVRRDLLVTLSYRTAFIGDVFAFLTQILLFYFLGKMIDSNELPTYGGTSASYLEFVVIGVVVGLVVQIGLMRVAAVIRGEQLMGTLESLFATPTSTTTIQLGSVAFDLVYIPIRTAVFLGVTTLAFGLDLHSDGLLPSTAMLLALIPFVWGLGLIGAAAILAFRRGMGLAGLVGTLLAVGSGAYFPLTLLPTWIQSLAALNPLAITINGMREALIGGEGWPGFGADLLVVGGAAVIALSMGVGAFRLALRREYARGTLGLY